MAATLSSPPLAHPQLDLGSAVRRGDGFLSTVLGPRRSRAPPGVVSALLSTVTGPDRTFGRPPDGRLAASDR